MFQVTNRVLHNRNTTERVVAWKLYRQEGPRQQAVEAVGEHV